MLTGTHTASLSHSGNAMGARSHGNGGHAGPIHVLNNINVKQEFVVHPPTPTSTPAPPKAPAAAAAAPVVQPRKFKVRDPLQLLGFAHPPPKKRTPAPTARPTAPVPRRTPRPVVTRAPKKAKRTPAPTKAPVPMATPAATKRPVPHQRIHNPSPVAPPPPTAKSSSPPPAPQPGAPQATEGPRLFHPKVASPQEVQPALTKMVITRRDDVEPPNVPAAGASGKLVHPLTVPRVGLTTETLVAPAGALKQAQTSPLHAKLGVVTELPLATLAPLTLPRIAAATVQKPRRAVPAPPAPCQTGSACPTTAVPAAPSVPALGKLTVQPAMLVSPQEDVALVQEREKNSLPGTPQGLYAPRTDQAQMVLSGNSIVTSVGGDGNCCGQPGCTLLVCGQVVSSAPAVVAVPAVAVAVTCCGQPQCLTPCPPARPAAQRRRLTGQQWRQRCIFRGMARCHTILARKAYARCKAKVHKGCKMAQRLQRKQRRRKLRLSRRRGRGRRRRGSLLAKAQSVVKKAQAVVQGGRSASKRRSRRQNKKKARKLLRKIAKQVCICPRVCTCTYVW